MSVKISPSKAVGTVTAPPSKSIAHRYLILAALSDGESRIDNIAYSEDIKATLDCIETLGAQVTRLERAVIVKGIDGKIFSKDAVFSCRESGSTIRFFMPVAMMLCDSAVFHGAASLLSRPFGVYEDICRSEGITFDRRDDGILVSGSLKSSSYTVPGNISSQFITGLIFALLLKNEECEIKILPPVESRSYIDLTVKAVQKFSGTIDYDGEGLIKIGRSTLSARNLTVEGDYSNAAFLDAFNIIGGDVKVAGLDPESAQGDKVYKKYFNIINAVKSPVIDIADCPDLGPILMALLSARCGGKLVNTARLRIKESNRGAVMCAELSKFGIKAENCENEIIIHEGKLSKPSVILEGHNDHRIVMSLVTLLSITGGELSGEGAVSKSFPDYFEVISSLGIKAERY